MVRLRGMADVPLRLKQELFIGFYVGEANGNATEAARMAGYKGNDVTLGAVGAENLQKPQIKAEITKRTNRLKHRLAMFADLAHIRKCEIAGMLANIASSSLMDVLNENGELDWNLARERGNDHLVKEVAVTERHSKDGSSRVTTTYKMDDRIRAADLLSDLMGWKREAAKNPIDSAKEMLGILRDDPKFADMDQVMLRAMVARRLNVAEADLVEDRLDNPAS